jgi:hypothetical protein
MGLGTYICECPYGYTGMNCESSKSSSKIDIRRLILTLKKVIEYFLNIYS